MPISRGIFFEQAIYAHFTKEDRVNLQPRFKILKIIHVGYRDIVSDNIMEILQNIMLLYHCILVDHPNRYISTDILFIARKMQVATSRKYSYI